MAYDPHLSDFDLLRVRDEFLKYAPAYAQGEAREAVDKVFELQRQGLLRDGIYYVVLADIVGATAMNAELGNEEMSERIKFFIRSTFTAVAEVKLANVGIFLKELGDAVLFIFSHFPDVLRWVSAVEAWLKIPNEGAWSEHPIRVRTVVHVGEVYLNGVSPVSLAVSQLFKVEKHAGAGEIVLTTPAFLAAWPAVARAYHAFDTIGSVEIEGYPSGAMMLYRLKRTDWSPPERIADEKIE